MGQKNVELKNVRLKDVWFEKMLAKDIYRGNRILGQKFVRLKNLPQNDIYWDEKFYGAKPLFKLLRFK